MGVGRMVTGAIALGIALAASSLAGDKEPAGDKTGLFKKEKEIALAGANFFEHLLVDPEGKRLYVTHGHSLEIIEISKGEKLKEIGEIDRASGIALSSDQKVGFATSSAAGIAIAFDTATKKKTKQIVVGKKPTTAFTVTSQSEVWTTDQSGDSLTCIHPGTLAVTATIPLPGNPSAGVEHADKATVYATLVKKSAIAKIDAKARKVTATWPVDPGEEPTQLAIDAKNGLLFAGCQNRKLVVVEIETGKVASSWDIGDECGSVAFDPETRDVYASCGGGTVSVFHVESAKELRLLTTIETPKGAKACDVDRKSHKLFVLAPMAGGGSSVIVFSRGGR
ncbi:YncE family protein [bacterium]|nr:YncE family protein [bacterium]